MASSYDEATSSSPPRSSSPVDCYSSSSSPPHESSFFEDEPKVQDPFAASVKATKPPRDYQRKRQISRSPSPIRTNAKRYRPHSSLDSPFQSIPWKTDKDDEEKAWSKALEVVFNQSNGSIDLGSHELRYISRVGLKDLAKFFVTSEAQENEQLPSLSPNAHQYVKPKQERQFQRTQSTTGWSNARHEVQLFLQNNKIQWLPPELFNLKRLTVLSLMNNKLTYIPPEIVHLTGLKDLNISRNELRYLPAEMLKMKLNRLLVIGNPFLPKQSSKTEVIPRVNGPISLFELCLRAIFQPVGNGQTVLQAYYARPLLKCEVPPNIEDILRKCDSKCIFEDPDALPPSTQTSNSSNESSLSDYNEVTGIGTCPSPTCGGIFVMHAEEAYTWESMVAGCSMGDHAPVRWRGCKHGCLQYMATLDQGEAVSDPGDGEEEFDFQPVDLGDGLTFD